jgi:hypothetical protein
MADLNKQILDQIRRDSFVPAVADGEDEGSQRSGETLTARMWPLTSHTLSERVIWSDAMSFFAKMVLTILAIKNEAGITINHVKNLKTRQAWAPQLPKDREGVVNEAVNRMAVNLGSPESLLEFLGDTEDIPLVITQMKGWIEFLEEAKAKAAPPPAPGSTTGSTPAKGKPNPTGANAGKAKS